MENSKIKIIFMGVPEFGAIILEKLITKFRPVLVITSPDEKQSMAPVKIVAQKHRISISQSEKLSKKQISKINPDLIIVAGYGQFISKEILNIPKYGCLNVHPSLLPKWRGSSPVQYAILKGEKKTGATIILMDEKMDAGPILAQKSITIEEKEDANNLSKKIAEIGGDLLVKIIPRWVKGEIKPYPQKKSEATFCKKFKKEDGRIDWTKSAKEIEGQVRALTPWPSSFCKLNNKTLKIWKASTSKQEKRYPLGKTLQAPYDKIAVQCKEDYLIIEKLQLEGRKIITSEEFLRGYPDFIGTILK